MKTLPSGCSFFSMLHVCSGCLLTAFYIYYSVKAFTLALHIYSSWYTGQASKYKELPALDELLLSGVSSKGRTVKGPVCHSLFMAIPVAPLFGAAAVFTVTAVKLPWEGRDKRGRDENNGLSCKLQTSIMVGEGEVCVFMLGGRWGCCSSGWRLSRRLR